MRPLETQEGRIQIGERPMAQVAVEREDEDEQRVKGDDGDLCNPNQDGAQSSCNRASMELLPTSSTF